MRAVTVLVSLLLLLPLGTAEAGTSLWSGYTIPSNGHADGGFVGARRTDGEVTYRLDAGAGSRATGYRKQRKVGTARRHARAAWILSRYGAVRIADQAAAVDVATYALVSGRPLAGKRARARLRATGRSEEIRGLARQLLQASRRNAGPYRIALTTSPAAKGGHVAVSARLTTYSGRPLGGKRVVVRLSGVAQSQRTSAAGRVSMTFPASQVGLRRVRLSVGRLPEWRLVVRPPKRPGASRIAIAGRRTRLVARSTVAVRATPRLSVTTPTSPGLVGTAARTGFQLTGSEGQPLRRVDVALFGPFASGVAPSCTGTPAARVSTAVAADGSYSTPAVTPARYGIYLWQVRLAGSTLNEPATVCGAPTRVQSRPAATLQATGSTRLTFGVTGLPTGYGADALLAVHGPFAKRANIGCGRKQVGSTSVRVTANGSYTSTRIPVSEPGFYGWQLVLPWSLFSQSLTTPCRTAGSVVQLP